LIDSWQRKRERKGRKKSIFYIITHIIKKEKKERYIYKIMFFSYIKTYFEGNKY